MARFPHKRRGETARSDEDAARVSLELGFGFGNTEPAPRTRLLGKNAEQCRIVRGRRAVGPAALPASSRSTAVR
jgi:hypothetical protein